MSRLPTSDIRVPGFVSDLVRDLRDRRMLPLVAVLALAIAAVPFLLSNPAADKAGPPTAGPPSAADTGAKLAVIADDPGLRDYHRRLRGDRPKDPFQQRFTGPQLAGSQLGNGASGPTTTISGGATPTADSGTGTEGGPPAGTGNEGPGATPPDSGGAPAPEPAWVVHLRIGQEGDMNARDLTQPEPMPSADNPVVVFRGLGSDGHSAIFRVDESVTAIYGDAKCLEGTDRCELVEIEPGFPVMFVYGDPERSLMLKVVGIEHNR